MFASYILGAVAVLAVGAVGQTTTDSESHTASSSTKTSSLPKTSTATTSSTSGPATHSIAVGMLGFVFSPNETEAKVGDTIRFVFYPGGHSVARSAFSHPCIPYEYTGFKKTGFWSDTKAPQAATADVYYDVKVNDTEPIFYYCAAPGSCSDHHMIGVINPRANETLDDQMEFAEQVQFQLKPGDPWPSETAGEQPSETEGANANTNPEEDSNNSDSKTEDHPHLSPGAIAGIAIGSAAVLILAAALVYLCGRRGGFDKAYRKSATAPFSSLRPNGPMTEGGQYPAAAAIPPSDPKSPGQRSFSTFSGPPDQDPYRSLTQSPQHTYYNGASPPPPSGGLVYSGYPTYQSSQGAYAPPVVGELGVHQPQAQPHQFPIELPTSVGSPIAPGSPPPQYPTSARRDSWTRGEEGQYRPGPK